jgi:hypothetical protein
MSAIKRFNSGYTLKTINSSDSITMDTSLVTITGNLVVLGAQTAIETTNTQVYDNILELNAGVTGTPSLNAGIQIVRGTSANVQLRWNETFKSWQITSDGTTYANIATLVSGTISTVPALTSVSQDTTPALGGNLNITSRTLYTDSSKGSIQVYGNTASGGGSGLWVTNSISSNAELVTKNKAFAISIVFG